MTDNKILVENKHYYPSLERSLLATILKNRKARLDVIAAVPVSVFFDWKHAEIFRLISSLVSKNVELDEKIVSSKLTGQPKDCLENEISKAKTINSSEVLSTYIDTLVSGHKLRETLEITKKFRSMAESGTDDVDQMLGKYGNEIFSLSMASRKKVWSTAVDLLKDADEEFAARITNPSTKDLVGFPSGLSNLDSIVKGFPRREMSIIAGIPSSGKTALSLMIAHDNLLSGESVCYFSLEMSRTKMAQRLLSLLSNVEVYKIMVGKLSAKEQLKVDKARDRFKRFSSNLLLSEDPMTMDEIAVMSKLAKMTNPNLSILFLDYIQFIRGVGSEQKELSEASTRLAQIAKELDVACVILSQMSRAYSVREDKRPKLSDLRGSGQLEADASIVVFMYNEFQHDPDAIDNQNKFEAIVGKNRSAGSLGTAHLKLDKRTVKFLEDEGNVI